MISANPNLTDEFVEKYLDKPLSFINLHQNKNVKKYPDLKEI